MTWEKLKNKVDQVSVPSVVKLENQFRTCALKKSQDPDASITYPDDLRVNFEARGYFDYEK
jgi:hypothetical protein